MAEATLSEREDLLADLVHHVLTIARRVHVASSSDDARLIPLTQLEGLVMQYIDRHPGVRVSEIGMDLGLQHSNASTALRALEEKGLVRRAPDSSDRRASTVWPTPAASENLERTRAHWAALLAGVETPVAVLRDAVRSLAAVEDELSR